jgi:formylmethanofuran dehydrogenase subunit E
MDAEQIMNSEDFKKCADFHGHICPGLSIGFRMAQAAMEKLKERRSEDEELVAVVETDACSADAVQVLTGCTFGKGNFIFKDYGKTVLTVFSRNTGEGVRVSLLPDGFPRNETHMALMGKVMSGEADEDEEQQFQAIHLQRSGVVLEAPDEKLFTIKTVKMPLPEKAKIEPSELCQQCGEPTMRTKLESIDGKRVCRDCLDQSSF